MSKINSVLLEQAFLNFLDAQPIYGILPASSVHPAQLTALKEALPTLMLPNDIQSEQARYHANDDEKRFQQLAKALFDSPKNTIIWALRGGYGSARLLPYLQKMRPPKEKKYLIGSSDITALHLFLSEHWGWPTIHGAGLINLLDETQDPNNFRRIAAMLTNQPLPFEIPLTPYNTLAESFEDHHPAFLTGGNLTLMATSLGTFWQPKTHQKIIFLEEVNEKGYRIDRLLTHLTQANIFKNARAVVLGSFLDKNEIANIRYAIERFATNLPLPVFKTDVIGHDSKNWPLCYETPYAFLPHEGKPSLTLTQKTRMYDTLSTPCFSQT